MSLTLEEFLKLYPWEEKYTANKPNRMDWFWNFELEIEPNSLWPFISDTSRLNQAMGLSKMTFEEKEGILYGKAKNAGIDLEWIEVPWNWVSGKYLVSIREYSKGFAYTVKAIFHLEKINDKTTKLYVYLGWIPRGFFYKLLLSASKKIIFNKYKTALNEIVKLSKNKKALSLLTSSETYYKIENKTLFERVKKQLLEKNLNIDIIKKLLEFIETGDDQDLYRIRVLELANKWKVSERELLIICMHATRLGLLTISWDIICPHCRGTRQEAVTLFEVPAKGSCEVCEIDFDNNSENSIEITFHIHPSIRNVPKVFFCSAEPAKKTHIKMQKVLGPKQFIEENLNLNVGSYRLRIKGERNFNILNITDTEEKKLINWFSADNTNFLSGTNPLIRIENPKEKINLYTIEELAWDPFVLKPAYIFTLQEFHDLFSAEAISSELKLELGLQTVFFTDIVGSSSLYDIQGDSKTFVQVKRHFEEIHKIVQENQGAIIKTIGDAVMASFPSPGNGIQAANLLIHKFDGKNLDGIRLRISIHYGQCIAVNLNSGIDYFGKTVNIAAKIQKLAGASQIVFTKQYKENPDVIKFLESNKIRMEEIQYEIPGMKDQFTIYRIDGKIN
ncbi:MAG TPA: DUF5939 domain-containing protein [Leptospiraceae bacterium]|nr:DUF5939 domain-containing protein [Leptospiraceae bacterium]HMW05683.1 DUF5939 domain-containing protein [Leptospiraceae bacterium]HMX33511.1 DUF5939 domain-containing protein [Leptospiraceae bacterium]HMY30284.1 DUF5939 domain-containing protein [Leptospiraceae bacterium]HMZ63637.1 DUF5939 domain-containing protein [Leptospiraceae bacterium]